MCVKNNQPLINRLPAFSRENSRVQVSSKHFIAFRIYLESNELYPSIMVLHRYSCDTMSL